MLLTTLIQASQMTKTSNGLVMVLVRVGVSLLANTIQSLKLQFSTCNTKLDYSIMGLLKVGRGPRRPSEPRAHSPHPDFQQTFVQR